METCCGCSTFRGKYSLRFEGKIQTGYIICCNNSVFFGICVFTAQNHLNISVPLSKIGILFVESNNSN